MPASVPDAKPPSPFVTSHSRPSISSASCVSPSSNVRLRTGSFILPKPLRSSFLPRAQSLCAHLLLLARLVAVGRVARPLAVYGRERDRRLAGDAPVFLRLQRRRPRPAVPVVLARPERPPDLARGRREQGLGRGVQAEVGAEVDDQQAVVAVAPE